MKTPPQAYVGRFAPTPSGPLHAGSLIAALGSWLDARQAEGSWRLRIDDIDAERSRPESETQIPETLEAHGLYWDGAIVYQSDHRDLYQEAINQLTRLDRTYPCACTRKELAQHPGPYPGFCRAGLPSDRLPRALRLRVPAETLIFEDRVFGSIQHDLTESSGDFVIRRADGYVAYYLATVVDDAAMGVTDVVRGGDLLLSTPQQLYLHDLLATPRPRHAHLPVLVDAAGHKLSKQNHAPALHLETARSNLYEALRALENALSEPLPPLGDFQDVDSLLGWATSHWALTTGLWPQASGPLTDTIENE